MKRLIIIAIFITFGTLQAQNASLSFVSSSDAKFFVYLNGVLQNSKSSGLVTINNLEEKDYHVRVVIDDPFEIATIQTIRPDKKHTEYSVTFNAVKEKVTVRQVKTKSSEQEWIPEETVSNPDTTIQSDKPSKQTVVPLRRADHSDTATRRIVNTIRNATVE